MRKSLSILFLVGIAVSLPVFAENGAAGCGCGHLVFKGQTGLGPNVMAATTNGTFANQTFGMTTGTGDCDPNSTVNNEYQKKIFVAANMDNLAQDMAKGSGEYLESLATIIGIDSQDRDAFYQFTQANYQTVFGNPNANQDLVVSALDDAMAANDRFAKYVR